MPATSELQAASRVRCSGFTLEAIGLDEKSDVHAGLACVIPRSRGGGVVRVDPVDDAEHARATLQMAGATLDDASTVVASSATSGRGTIALDDAGNRTEAEKIPRSTE